VWQVVGVIEQEKVEQKEQNGATGAEGGPVTAGTEAKAGEATAGQRKKYHLGSEAMFARDSMELLNPIEDGQVKDWDLLQGLWEYAFQKKLSTKAADHPVLLARPPGATRADMEKACELMFEKLSVPALFLAKNPVLSSFATGRATSLVVDSGFQTTTVSAVHDGYVLSKAVTQSNLAGKMLSTLFQKSLESDGTQIKPLYSFRRKETQQPGVWEVKDLDISKIHPSFKAFQEMCVVNDIKESTCLVSEQEFDEAANANIPTISYELPDGKTIEIGTERFNLPEVLFKPEIASRYPDAPEIRSLTGGSVKGISGMVVETIEKCDVDVRRELFSGVVLTGGSSLFRNMRERLDRELGELVPASMRLRVHAPNSSMERRCSVWIGGSILASLGSFQQMWLSKGEYEEHGATLVHRKCP